MNSNFLNQTAEYATRNGRDVYGKPTLSESVSIPCRFQDGSKKTFGDNSEKVFVDAELWIDPTVSLAINDRVIFSGVSYEVLGVEVKNDISGNKHHSKAYLRKVAI